MGPSLHFHLTHRGLLTSHVGMGVGGGGGGGGGRSDNNN